MNEILSVVKEYNETKKNLPFEKVQTTKKS